MSPLSHFPEDLFIPTCVSSLAGYGLELFLVAFEQEDMEAICNKNITMLSMLQFVERLLQDVMSILDPSSSKNEMWQGSLMFCLMLDKGVVGFNLFQLWHGMKLSYLECVI